MASKFPTPPANLLLSRLNGKDWQLISDHLTKHHLKVGDVLQKAGDKVVRTWFPCGAASASYQVWVDPGANAIDVGTIGHEGAVGGIVSNGKVPAYANAEVRDPGLFLSIRITRLERLKEESVALRHWFARYSDCLIAQIFQNSACGSAHTIRQRAARWLLASTARSGSDEVALTHEQFAAMLGVGRTFVTRVVKDLRDSGLITTRRGTFILRDPARLRAMSCDCSDYVTQHYQTVMAGLYVSPMDEPG